MGAGWSEKSHPSSAMVDMRSLWVSRKSKEVFGQPAFLGFRKAYLGKREWSARAQKSKDEWSGGREAQRSETGERKGLRGRVTVELEPLNLKATASVLQKRRDGPWLFSYGSMWESVYFHANISEHVYSMCTCGIPYMG